jgi:hypothetical protein
MERRHPLACATVAPSAPIRLPLGGSVSLRCGPGQQRPLHPKDVFQGLPARTPRERLDAIRGRSSAAAEQAADNRRPSAGHRALWLSQGGAQGKASARAWATRPAPDKCRNSACTLRNPRCNILHLEDRHLLRTTHPPSPDAPTLNCLGQTHGISNAHDERIARCILSASLPTHLSVNPRLQRYRHGGPSPDMTEKAG